MKKFSKAVGEMLAMVIAIFVTAVFMALIVRFMVWVFS